jgi:hypothetical protein
MVQVLTLVETKANFVEIIRFHVFGAYPWQWKKEGGGLWQLLYEALLRREHTFLQLLILTKNRERCSMPESAFVGVLVKF